MTAFVISAAGTVWLLLLLASVGPFDHANAPSLLWSVVLWGMVGVAAFVIMMRLVTLALLFLGGMFYVGKRGAVAMAYALRILFGAL